MRNLFILMLLQFAISGCESHSNNTSSYSNDYDDSSQYGGPSDYSESNNASAEVEQELPDGTYNCDASNVTSGNGPYALGCDKNGDEVTINFSNGGYIVTDIDSIESDGSGNWSAETTHASEGESWDVEISE